MVRTGFVTGVLGMAMACAVAMPARSDDFYAGKRLEIVISSAPGGAYDAIGRLVGRYIPANIPGNPTIVIRNMPGAGGQTATTWLYNIAPKDGLTLGTVAPQALVESLVGGGTKYDSLKFEVIGSVASLVYLCAVRFDAPVKTLTDAMKTEVTMGSSSPGGAGHSTLMALNHIVGTKFKPITGYKNSAETALAVERGEIHGACGGTDQINPKRQFAAEGKLRVLVQYGLEPSPRLTAMGAPMVWDFVKKPEDRAVLEFLMATQAFGRPFIMPPGVPKDRADIIRAAFDKTVADKDFRSEGERMELDISPMPAQRMREILEKTFAASPEIIKRAGAALE